MRRALKYYEQRDFRGGINQEEENAAANQVFDARNVWCPNGKLEQRPGIKGEGACFATYTDVFGVVIGTNLFFYDDTAGTYASPALGTLDISNATVGDIIYIELDTSGSPSSWWAVINPTGIPFTHNNNSAADVVYVAEYWDGDRWAALASHQIDEVSGLYATSATTRVMTLNGAVSGGAVLYFAHPNSSEQTTVNSVTSEWVRLRIIEGTCDAATGFYCSTTACAWTEETASAASYSHVCGSRQIQFTNAKRYVHAYIGHFNVTSVNVFQIGVYDSPSNGNGFRYREASSPSSYVGWPASFAFVYDTDDAFFAYNHIIYHVRPETTVASTIQAQIESSAALVGAGAAYDKSWIAWLDSFPKANLISYFKGSLWAAGLDGEPSTIRWSAPIPAHKVWPAISFEVLGEDDDSPITALATMQEHLVVFKRDSIWRMVLDKTDPETGLLSYVGIKDVAGVGCINHATVAKIPHGILFLAEDGVYLYNGTSAVQKVSGAIDGLMSDVTANASLYACSLNWKSVGCCLISVPIGSSTQQAGYGSANAAYVDSVVLVYDYKNMTQGEDGQTVGAWWVWSDLHVASWLPCEGDEDMETVYFVDKHMRVMQLGNFTSDHGVAVDAFVQTHRLGKERSASKRAREIAVTSTNKVSTVSVQVSADDEPFTSTYLPISMSDPTGVETELSDVEFGVAGCFTEKRAREARISLREDGDWFRAKIRHSNKNHKFELHGYRLGVAEMGRR